MNNSDKTKKITQFNRSKQYILFYLSSFVALVNWSQPVLSSSACRLWYVSPSRVHIPFHISPLVVLLPIAVIFHNSSILTDPYAWTFRKDTCHVMWTPGRVRSICFFICLKNGQIISAHQRTALYYLYLGQEIALIHSSPTMYICIDVVVM